MPQVLNHGPMTTKNSQNFDYFDKFEPIPPSVKRSELKTGPAGKSCSNGESIFAMKPQCSFFNEIGAVGPRQPIKLRPLQDIPSCEGDVYEKSPNLRIRKISTATNTSSLGKLNLSIQKTQTATNQQDQSPRAIDNIAKFHSPRVSSLPWSSGENRFSNKSISIPKNAHNDGKSLGISINIENSALIRHRPSLITRAADPDGVSSFSFKTNFAQKEVPSGELSFSNPENSNLRSRQGNRPPPPERIKRISHSSQSSVLLKSTAFILSNNPLGNENTAATPSNKQNQNQTQKHINEPFNFTFMSPLAARDTNVMKFPK